MVTYKQAQPKVVSNSHSDLLSNAEEECMGGGVVSRCSDRQMKALEGAQLIVGNSRMGN